MPPQLFHTLDPFTFRERVLDREAEEYIVGWARELATNQPIKINIHFPNTEAQTKTATELSEAFWRYFSDRAGAVQRDINELFRVGRRSLAIGAAILIVAMSEVGHEPQFAIGFRQSALLRKADHPTADNLVRAGAVVTSRVTSTGRLTERE